MRKIILFLYSLLFSITMFAQNIVVESFMLLETDLTANMEGSIVYDQNGEKCALIKVRSNPPTKGFSFDVGHLGVMKVEIKGAETWLYVPHGVRKISIQHEQLGFLDNYDLGMPVKRATTYQLNLRVGSVQTIIEEQFMKQFLVFRLNPKDAVVEVAGDSWIPNSDGVCRKMLSYGTYDYRVKAKNYHDEVGKVTLNNAEETKIVEVNLRPAYGWIEVKGIGDLTDAVLYVDDEMIGRAPIKTDKLSSGRHSVRIVKDHFRAHIEEVIVEDNQTTTLSPTLIGEFSTVSITTKSGVEIWVDGERKGTSSWSGSLSFGEHLMETKQASHRSQSRVINILPTESTKFIQLPEPQPIYGRLSIEVLPDFADIYIDGQKVGQTPKIMPKIFIGEHKVEVRAEGKDPLEKNITISEGIMSTITGELKKATPKTLIDEHTVEVRAEGKEPLKKNVTISEDIMSTITNEAKTETPKIQNELVFNVEGVQFTMKRVEGGTFIMGATSEQGSDAYGTAKPAHKVTLNDFYIGETEVTQELWYAVMGHDPSYFIREDNLPKTDVSWDDCQKFIQKLNQLTGQTFSLPTEAQWEFAARGGNMSKGYKYSGSSDLDRVAWYSGNSHYQPHPVAQLQSNELGLYDMSGNMWEWCSDWYGSYPSSSQNNPVGPSSGYRRVYRGGGHSNTELHSRVSSRSCGNEVGYCHFLSLRLALVSFDSSAKSSVRKDETPSVASELKTETPKIQNELVFNINGVQFIMKGVEGGTFTMGATPEKGSDAYSYAKPAHQVTLDSYYIGVTEVTQELWQAVMGSNPSYFRGSSWPLKGTYDGDNSSNKVDNRPVEQVSWDDCQAFIQKLNQLTGQTFSLPTEAQWEFAARGGNLSRGYRYAGSNNLDSVAWFPHNSMGYTHPVAQKQPNELGIYDMSGNVSEWCSDWWGAYSSSSQRNPYGPSSGSFRVSRGGSCHNTDFITYRDGYNLSSAYNSAPSYNLGFRLSLVSSH